MVHWCELTTDTLGKAPYCKASATTVAIAADGVIEVEFAKMRIAVE